MPRLWPLPHSWLRVSPSSKTVIVSIKAGLHLEGRIMLVVGNCFQKGNDRTTQGLPGFHLFKNASTSSGARERAFSNSPPCWL